MANFLLEVRDCGLRSERVLTARELRAFWVKWFSLSFPEARIGLLVSSAISVKHRTVRFPGTLPRKGYRRKRVCAQYRPTRIVVGMAERRNRLAGTGACWKSALAES